jgi:phosphoserine phosphatase RsbU/P
MAFLITLGDESVRFELKKADTVLGRHPECDVVIDAGAISRYHAKIVFNDGGYWIEDLKSRNGTFVNGQMIGGPTRLQESDQIRICDVELAFYSGERPEFLGPDNDSSSAFGFLAEDEDAHSTQQLSGVEVRTDASGSVRLSASAETKLAALLQINQDLGRALKLDEVLPRVLESLFKVFPQADRGFIVLVDSEGRLVPRWMKARRAGDEEGSVRISRTIVRKVMESGQPILSIDAASDERFQMSESIADFRIRSMICAPLLDSDGGRLGALQIDTCDQRHRFGEDEIDVLAAVASQAGIAIHNAQLHEQSLRQLEVEQDLKLATDVQRVFLPAGPPKLDGYSFSAFYQAAMHIGGDYYDYIRLSDGRVGVVVADVVGHGVAAAMYMAKLSAETRFLLAREKDPAVAVMKLNDCMSQLQVERFVTFLLVVVDRDDHTLTILNAGHMAPIVRGIDGTTREPGEEESGLPMAIAEGLEYEAVTVKIEPGEIVVLYTDGVNEAMDGDGELFSIDRVRQLVAQGGSPEIVTERIITTLKEFTGMKPQDDDICVVAIGRDA